MLESAAVKVEFDELDLRLEGDGDGNGDEDEDEDEDDDFEEDLMIFAFGLLPDTLGLEDEDEDDDDLTEPGSGSVLGAAGSLDAFDFRAASVIAQSSGESDSDNGGGENGDGGVDPQLNWQLEPRRRGKNQG